MGNTGYITMSDRHEYMMSGREEAGEIFSVSSCHSSVNEIEGCEEEIILQQDDDDIDARSLHLHTLVEEFLQPSSPLPFSSDQHHNQISAWLLGSHQFRSNFREGASQLLADKSSLQELQAILQSADHLRHTGLRREVTRALKLANQDVQQCAPSANSKYSSRHEQLQGMVLGHLREQGINAGICKSKRSESSRSQEGDNCKSRFPTEEYVYMDVILGGGAAKESESRALIDLRFRAGFEIARPSPAYVELLKVVPTCYVGSPRVLHKIIRLVSGAMKRSMESQGMPLPPWRTLSFLHSKWLSPNYSRTLNNPPQFCQQKPASTNPKRAAFSIARKSSISNIKFDTLRPPTSPVASPFPHRNAAVSVSNRVLTNSNSTLAPLSFVPKHGMLRHHPTHGSTSIVHKPNIQAEPIWQLPQLITQRSLSPTKPRKRVGALTIALVQHSSMTTNAGRASIHLTI
ncbi:hypothetical protein L7F22_040480 [Adiantum nelumboides]|nr:hypothetical protein [Adiantum nelumboides]